MECAASAPGPSAARLKAFPDIGVDGGTLAPNAEVSKTKIGTREARLISKAFSSTACAVTMEVTSTSRVDVVVSDNSSLEEACEAATNIATAIEPRLPK
ncbi:hypothetical protein GCM10010185_47850 [Saccharothrix coeruleofusca]|uniref:Uncharacterized protein n=1 Tax=Saccharothrix coeruleofusca TaxID=33919 RepID=A0A918APG6_9PSEU|nr:hypothetical protein GCM10010185_47850 [Saccharothrix coeruleofusca]